MPSFDFSSEADMAALNNAIDVTRRAIDNRYDFKGTSARVELNEKDRLITLFGDSDFQLGQIRDLLFPALCQAGFRCTAPDGAYYILADFSGLSGLPDTEFALWLAKERGVAPVPGSSFFSRPELGRRYVRFVFCKTDDLLTEAAARLTGGGGRGAADVQR